LEIPEQNIKHQSLSVDFYCGYAQRKQHQPPTPARGQVAGQLDHDFQWLFFTPLESLTMIQWVTIKDLPEDGQQYTIEISHGTRNKKMVWKITFVSDLDMLWFHVTLRECKKMESTKS